MQLLCSVGRGGWSSDGIQVISNITRGDVTTVLCNSTHLTSFAVLVDVAGGLEVCINVLPYNTYCTEQKTGFMHTAKPFSTL